MELGGTVLLATDQGPVRWSGVASKPVPLGGADPEIQRFIRTDNAAYAVGADGELHVIDARWCEALGTTPRAVVARSGGDLLLLDDGLRHPRTGVLLHGGGDRPSGRLTGARRIDGKVFIVDESGAVFEYRPRLWRCVEVSAPSDDRPGRVRSVHDLGDDRLLLVRGRPGARRFDLEVVDPRAG